MEEPVPGASAEVMAGGLFAAAVHVGPYDQAGLTTQGLLAWCGDHGHTPRGPLREVYLADPRDTAWVAAWARPRRWA